MSSTRQVLRTGGADAAGVARDSGYVFCHEMRGEPTIFTEKYHPDRIIIECSFVFRNTGVSDPDRFVEVPRFRRRWRFKSGN
jgi:hypothetical protein